MRACVRARLAVCLQPECLGACPPARACVDMCVCESSDAMERVSSVVNETVSGVSNAALPARRISTDPHLPSNLMPHF